MRICYRAGIRDDPAMWEHLRQISDKRVRGFECITAPLEINPDPIADFQIDRIMKMAPITRPTAYYAVPDPVEAILIVEMIVDQSPSVIE